MRDEVDSTCARAYAGIAYCSAFLYMVCDSAKDNLAQARAVANAIELTRLFRTALRHLRSVPWRAHPRT